jgi:tripartite-type tricarboxylate transporter receptor subunit TctC
VVENRPGGGNIVGAQAAARSAPDGYTFFFATSAALVTNPFRGWFAVVAPTGTRPM